MRCRHCYSSSGEEPKETNYELLIQQINQIQPLRIVFSGGETMLVRNKIREVVARLENPAFVVIATNGSLLTPETCQELKGFADRLQISLDSMQSDTFESIRKRPLLPLVLQGIQNAVQSGIEVQIAYCVLAENIGHFPAVMDFCKATGVKFLNVLVPRPAGRCNTVLPETVVLSEYRKILDYGKKIGLKTNIHDPATQKLGIPNDCLAAKEIVAIDVENHFKPCPLLEISAGRDFFRAWHSKPFESIRRLRSKNRCKAFALKTVLEAH